MDFFSSNFRSFVISMHLLLLASYIQFSLWNLRFKIPEIFFYSSSIVLLKRSRHWRRQIQTSYNSIRIMILMKQAFGRKLNSFLLMLCGLFTPLRISKSSWHKHQDWNARCFLYSFRSSLFILGGSKMESLFKLCEFKKNSRKNRQRARERKQCNEITIDCIDVRASWRNVHIVFTWN